LRLAAVDPQDAVDELNAGGLDPTQASSFHQVVSPIRTALNTTTVPISRLYHASHAGYSVCRAPASART